MKKKKFEELPTEEKKEMNNDFEVKENSDVSQQGGDFDFAPEEGRVYEQKFTTKPTTFTKDAFKRFAKNKSSLVAAGILAILIGMAIIVPIVNKNDITTNNLRTKYLPPKWFDDANGFMDGTRSVDNAVLDPKTEKLPSDSEYRAECVIGNINVSTRTTDSFNDSVSKYGHGGDFVVTSEKVDQIGAIQSPKITFDAEDNVGLTVNFDIEAMREKNNSNGLIFRLYLNNTYDSEFNEIIDLYNFRGTDYIETFSNNDLLSLVRSSSIYEAAGKPFRFTSYFVIEVTAGSEVSDVLNGLYIKNVLFTKEKAGTDLSNCNILDGVTGLTEYRKIPKPTETIRQYSLIGDTYANVTLHNAIIKYGSFRYDAYKHAYGEAKNHVFGKTEIETFVSKGWMTYEWGRPIYKSSSSKPASNLGENGDFGWNTKTNEYYIKEKGKWVSYDGDIFTPGTFTLTKEGETYCPIREIQKQVYTKVRDIRGNIMSDQSIEATISWYRYDYFRGYLTSCETPKYIFGTDRFGRDFFKMVFAGLLVSLGLGVMASFINIFIGVIWGSISGYFGGWVDIVMERVTEILGGIPWIIMMTLIILLLGSNFWTFLLALCLTGWMGIANITREQFYRYKGREYVLASRTLGASDARLIFRHILPNGIGTIVTSSVLMIPGVIFTEANISYLLPNLLNFSNPTFGISLSNVQADIKSYPYLIVSASIVMALIMISFNLFGNGLRDAFNPSLKGSDE